MKKTLIFMAVFMLTRFVYSVTLPLLPDRGLPAFGPYFIPDNSAMTGINLYYITQTAVSTKVYFGIVGDMDWARSDYNNVRIHKMRFSDMEENARYRFETGSGSEGHVMTIPYGGEYEFTFAVARDDRFSDFKADNIRFMIVLDKNGRLSARKWAKIYLKNKALFSSTITVPVFDWDEKALNSPFLNKKFVSLAYRHCHFLIIKSAGLDKAKLTKYLSPNPEDKNYVVIDFMSRKDTEAYYNYFSSRADMVLSPLKSGDWMLIDKPRIFHEVKKKGKKLVLK